MNFVLNTLRMQLDAQLPGLTAPDKRLTIMFCGYTYWPQPEAKVYLLTNWEHGASGHFAQIAVPLENRALVSLAGDSRTFAADSAGRLQQLAERTDLKPSDILRFAVAHLRKAAQKSVFIDEQCNSAIIGAQPDSVITHTYHSELRSRVAYGCDVIMPTMVGTGIELVASGTIAGPTIKPKDPCWCDSGMPYRKCHMKHYGAALAHAGFSRPLPWTMEEVRATPVPSGVHCTVSSRYT